MFSPVAFTGHLVSGGKQQDLKVFPQFIRPVYKFPQFFPLSPPQIKTCTLGCLENCGLR